MNRILLTVSALVFSMILLHPVTARSAMTAYVPQQLMRTEGELSQLLEEFIPRLEEIDRQGLRKVRESLKNLNQATTRFQQRYYQYDYIEQRANHVQNIAILLIELIDRQEDALRRGDVVSRWHRGYANSSEIRGLQGVVRMALYEERRDSAKNGNSPDRIDAARQAALDYLLASLVAPPQIADADYLQEVKTMRLKAYDSLATLKGEMEQLGAIYNRIKNKGGTR